MVICARRLISFSDMLLTHKYRMSITICLVHKILPQSPYIILSLVALFMSQTCTGLLVCVGAWDFSFNLGLWEARQVLQRLY